jgi:hypothetical protein
MLTDVARTAKESFTFLSAKGDPMVKGDVDRPFLILGADRSGPGRLVPLPITGLNLRVAEAPGQIIWIGGLKVEGVVSGAPVFHAYLAKLDREGHLFWGREFGDRRQSAIQNLAPLPSGDVVVAGMDHGSTWLARMSRDGKTLWQRHFGTGRTASVRTAGEHIVVAALESSAEIVPPVGFWMYDVAGQLPDHRVVRQGVNQSNDSFPGHPRPVIGKLAIEPFGDDTYLFSKPFGLSPDKPLEVVKINSLGQTVWRKEAPETSGPSGRIRITSCLEAITILSNGNPLVACNYFNYIHLIQFNSQTGEFMQNWVNQPTRSLNCGGVKFLRELDDGVVWIFGSSGACTWLGQLSLRR